LQDVPKLPTERENNNGKKRSEKHSALMLFQPQYMRGVYVTTLQKVCMF